MNKRNWLIEIRNSKGLTHQQVADEVNISRQYYGMIENGERLPSVDKAKKIGELLGFDWTIFFENKSYKTLRKTTSA